MTRKVPDCELAPYSVPCGPRSASMRSMSMKRGSGLRPLCVIGCSSRYRAEDETAAELQARACDAPENDRRASGLALRERQARDVLRDVVDLRQAAHRDRACIKGLYRLRDVLHALGALGRRDDDLVQAHGSLGFLRCRSSHCHREHGRYGRRQRRRSIPGASVFRVRHVLPSAVVRIVATGRRPGNPPPAMRCIAATYQFRNCCVNCSIVGDSGPGT